MRRKVLLVDDDAAVREALIQTLELSGFEPVGCGTFIEAKDHIATDFEGVVVSDIRMPGRDGYHLLEHVQKIDRDLPVILLTGEGDIPMAVRGISLGAFAFLEKPCAPQDLTATVETALENRRDVLENRRAQQRRDQGDAASRLLIGQSQLARELRARVRRVARSPADALIAGPPGSGTSKVAEVIHLLSERANAPYLKLPGAAQTPDTLAVAFDGADGGALFLDEVGALPADAQYALMERLEQSQPVRVLAGTYRDLLAEVTAGAFLHDLYYKLAVTTIRIPSLRDRAEDIPMLFRHYVEHCAEQAGVPVPAIPADTIAELLGQDWPGNARALMSAAMRFALGLSEPRPVEGTGLAEQMARFERALLIDALGRHKGRAADAAKALKLPRKTFYDKLARHKLRTEDYR